MSADSEISLGEAELSGDPLDCSKPNEFRCGECGARCSRSPTDPEIEYGHYRDCPERPAAVDANRPKGGQPFHEDADEASMEWVDTTLGDFGGAADD